MSNANSVSLREDHTHPDLIIPQTAWVGPEVQTLPTMHYIINTLNVKTVKSTTQVLSTLYVA